MTGIEVASAQSAVARLVAATGLRYELRGRLAGGETGAHEVAGPAGERLVLKWETDPASQVERRRDRLMAAAFDPLTDRQRDAYVAHLLLRILDRPIRGNRHDKVEVWLGVADQLLPG